MKVETKGPSNSPTIDCEWKRKTPAKPARKRKSRDRRLLEALLKCLTVYVWPENMDSKLYSTSGHDRIYGLSKDNEQQLIAIKEAMERKGGRK